MDVGNSNGWRMDEVVTKQEIVDRIGAVMPLQQIEPNYVGEVATRFRYRDSDQEIGIISSVTDSFCSTCSRARLSAEGKLHTCLFASNGVDLRQLLRSEKSDEEIAKVIIDVWNHRVDRYSDERVKGSSSNNRSKIEMSYIGG